MNEKLFFAVNLAASLVLVSACGVSPNGPSELPQPESQAIASASSASMAHTSGKRTIQPPSVCNLGRELTLRLSSRGRGFVEVLSNIDVATNQDCPLSWSLEPAQAAKQMGMEPAANRSAGLRVSLVPSTLRGFWVVANALDGQMVKLYLPLNPDTAD